MSRLSQGFLNRWELAKAAFVEVVDRKSLPDVEFEKSNQQIVLGWIVPQASAPMPVFRTKSYLYSTDKGFQLRGAKTVADKCEAVVSVVDQMLVVQINEQKMEYCHGETFELAGQSLKAAIVTSRAFLDCVRAMTMVLTLMLLTSIGGARTALAQSAGEKTTILQEPISARMRDPIEIRFRTKGWTEFATDKMNAELSIGGVVVSQLPIRSVELVPAEYMIYVDRSSSCSRRNMEGELNNSIYRLIQRLPESSRVSITGYHRSMDGSDVFDTLFPLRSATQLKSQSKFVTCYPNSVSLSIGKVLKRAAVESSAHKASDRYALVLSSGNGAPETGLDEVLAQNLFQARVFLYSPFVPEDFTRNLAPLLDKHGGKWSSRANGDLASSLDFEWRIRADANVSKSGDYALTLKYPANDGEQTLQATVQLSDNPAARLRYWLIVVVLTILMIAFVIWLVRTVLKYYGKQLSADGKYVLSRRWRGDLFGARDKYPVLFINHPQQAARAYVFDSSKLTIGAGPQNQIHLSGVGFANRAQIIRRAPKTFELNINSGAAVRVGDEIAKGSVFLKTGDEIQIGHYTMRFLFAKGDLP